MDLDGADASSTRTVRVGEELVLRLSENPTTGYAWEIAQTGPGVLRIVSNEYEPGGSRGAAAMPGGGGHRVVRLVAERAGTVRLTAVQRRPWDAPGVAQQTRDYTIEVR
jgi:inhibitor of cysteine peptidase